MTADQSVQAWQLHSTQPVSTHCKVKSSMTELELSFIHWSLNRFVNLSKPKSLQCPWYAGIAAAPTQPVSISGGFPAQQGGAGQESACQACQLLWAYRCKPGLWASGQQGQGQPPSQEATPGRPTSPGGRQVSPGAHCHSHLGYITASSARALGVSQQRADPTHQTGLCAAYSARALTQSTGRAQPAGSAFVPQT